MFLCNGFYTKTGGWPMTDRHVAMASGPEKDLHIAR